MGATFCTLWKQQLKSQRGYLRASQIMRHLWLNINYLMITETCPSGLHFTIKLVNSSQMANSTADRRSLTDFCCSCFMLSHFLRERFLPCWNCFRIFYKSILFSASYALLSWLVLHVARCILLQKFSWSIQISIVICKVQSTFKTGLWWFAC